MRTSTPGQKMVPVFLAIVCWCGLTSSAPAQYSFIETPFNSSSQSFYESFGTSWGLQGRGWFLNVNGPAGAAPGVAPVFGGFDPNAQTTFGGGFGGSGVSGRFAFTAGQGSDRSIVGAAPSVTVPNGGQGFFADVTQRPFVLGLVPVVGGSEPISPLRWRLSRMAQEGTPPDLSASRRGNEAPIGDHGTSDGSGNSSTSSADRGDLSVADIRARQAAEDQSTQLEIQALLDKARSLEEAGKIGVAKIYYKRAKAQASGAQQTEIASKIRALEAKSK